MTEREKMLAGELYLANDPALVEGRRRSRRLCHAFNAAPPDDDPGRLALLHRLFGALGPGGYVEPPFHCDYGSQIYVGARLYMNFDCVVLDCARVDIGDDVMFAPGVHVYTATHPLDPVERISGREFARPVRIGSRVWLGGRVVVLPGVTIGDDTVVASGSVVSRDLPPRVLAAGQPARVLREL